MFSRLGKGKTSKPSIFHRFRKDEQPKASIFTRIEMGEISSSASVPQKKVSVFSRLDETNEVQSSVPSHMKHVSALDVKVDDALKVKRCVLVLTGHGAKASSKERPKEKEQTSSTATQAKRSMPFFEEMLN